VTSAPPPRDGAGPDVTQPDDSQLSPGAWLARNGIYLVMAAALLVFLYYKFGLSGMWSIFLVAVGLGLVIFFHELGHFAVAKWCDVYVQTFSIGFGPALPGCRVKWGETVYKISLLPLGGYVQMLGEGTDSEEDENNPRSYKNKPVGQRMMIISAGVIMNVILAFLCFILVFSAGKERQAGVIGWVDPGNQAWTKGIPSGAVLVQVGDRVARPERPLYFTDLLSVVLNSAWGEKIHIAYLTYDGPSAQPVRHEVDLEPRKDEKDDRPMIGVSPPDGLELLPAQVRSERPLSYFATSAAAAARQAFPWHPGDAVVAATDPDHPDTVTDLPRPVGTDSDLGADWELARRCYALAGKPMTLRVRHKDGQAEEVTPGPGRFEFGDTVIATTDPDDPDRVAALPPDPRDPDGKQGDYFEYSRRLQRLAGRFMVFRVRHADRNAEEDLWVPPAYHLTLGARMRMGLVKGVRDNSPARQAGVVKDDILKEVLLQATDAQGKAKEGEGQHRRFVIGGGNPGQAVDPVRLPYELRRWAEDHLDPKTGKGVQAVLTVVHTKTDAEQARVTETLKPVDWDRSWRFDKEMPGSPSAPMAVPELGLAYQVDTIVEDVAGGSPAEGRLQKNDIIKAIRSKRMGTKADAFTDGDWDKLETDQWARIVMSLQRLDSPELALQVARERGGSTAEETVTLTLERDPAWPLADRGLLLMPDLRLQKAGNPWRALVMGLQETWMTIRDVYGQLRGFLTGRISFKNAGGPLKIGALAYSAAGAGIFELLFFLGLISINLAVINFLPIPFLDGGHMVFLIYEKIRGKPARESVMATATYAGLLFLLVVMILVFYLDISSLFFKH
jgi:regulator of sigma E protease